jgi:hypothetical protein
MCIENLCKSLLSKFVGSYMQINHNITKNYLQEIILPSNDLLSQ